MKNWWILLLLCGVAFGQVKVASSNSSPPSVPLLWTEATPSVATFYVYRALTAGGEDYTTPLVTVPGTQFSYTDFAVTPGTQYFYTVKSAVGSGALEVKSLPSNEVNYTIRFQAPQPPVVSITVP